MKIASNILTPQLAFEYFKVAGKGSLEEKASLWMKIVQHAAKKANFESLYHIYLQLFTNEKLPVAWMPDEKVIENANITSLQKELGIKNYRDLHTWSVENRAEFWEKTIERLGIKFQTPYKEVLNLSGGVEHPEWLSGAAYNITDSCFSASPEEIAIVSGKEGSMEMENISCGELKKRVNKFSSGLIKQGFKVGDRIILYMPLTVESIISYLGIIRAGMVVVSVADSFSSSELKKRIEMTEAKGLVTCDGYLYGGKELEVISKVRQAASIKTIICSYLQNINLQSNELLWENVTGSEEFEPHIGHPEDVTNILFSSGTTKEPKSIPWTHITPIKCASDAYYHHDIKPSDVVTWTTGMGWMMAPWLIYASLINKATLAVYSGAATGPGFGKFAEQAGITVLGTIPSVVKAWRNNAYEGKFNWKVRVFSSTGEPSNAEDYFYLMSLANFNAPVIEYCGGTEIGGGYITGSIVQAASPATFTTPALGVDFYLLNQDQKPTEGETPGEVFIVPPSIGLTQRLLNRDHHDEYYAGMPKGPAGEVLRKHGDAFEVVQQLHTIFYKS
ncbi:MAG: AMP-binding protein, partial [Cytophagaceae bacterium]